VWVPRAMFNSSIPYGMFFYVQGHGPAGDWTWFQSSWQNLQMPPPPADGLWNSITARVDDMIYTDNAKIPYAMTADTSTQIHQWGLKIGKGNAGATSAADYVGDIYIDSITVSGAGPTPTVTLTPTITPTVSETEVETASETATITPTVTETEVETATETPTISPTVTETEADTPTPTATP
jgi:hypothetical protein